MSDLNDYLDGRLGPGEREAFERRLESDPELGRRLEAAHEVRAALRSGDEELSPGFYTRTVARFEAERRPKSRLPFGLTWSTAGLAAAGLAAAIFIPLMLRDEIPMPAAEHAETERIDVSTPAVTDEKALSSVGYADTVEDAEPAPEKSPETRSAEEGRSQLKKEATRQVALDEPFAPDPMESLDEDIAEGDLDQAAATAPAEPKRRIAVEARKRDKLAPPPPPSAAQPKPESEGAAEESFANYQAVVSGVQSTAGKDQETPGEPSKGLAAVTLPDDRLPPDVVWVEGSHSEIAWKSGSLSADDAVIRMLGDTAGARGNVTVLDRFLMIGKRPGLDACSELRLTAHPTHWEVSFDERGSVEGSVACGLLIPSDGREIRFMGKRVDE